MKMAELTAEKVVANAQIAAEGIRCFLEKRSLNFVERFKN